MSIPASSPGARKTLIRSLVIGLSIFLGFASDAGRSVQAQTYCAMFDSGGKSCGLPSLDSCRQTISGVGGYCTPDATPQMRPDFFGGRGMFPDQQTPPPPAAGPQDPNWMPPPPGQ